MSTNAHDKVRTFANLTREQVRALGRPAWAHGESDQQETFYFDGSRFWRYEGGRPSAPAAVFMTPPDGWVHSPECGCAVCEAWRGL
jgi:hypothetical protein